MISCVVSWKTSPSLKYWVTERQEEIVLFPTHFSNSYVFSRLEYTDDIFLENWIFNYVYSVIIRKNSLISILPWLPSLKAMFSFFKFIIQTHKCIEYTKTFQILQILFSWVFTSSDNTEKIFWLFFHIFLLTIVYIISFSFSLLCDWSSTIQSVILLIYRYLIIAYLQNQMPHDSRIHLWIIITHLCIKVKMNSFY